MTTNHSHSAPPVIRVFLSSTFADMERERSYFNEVLTPKISRICAARGVSFFSVDLRWGITQEDQVNGQVLPICLSEIDKCRPYFIGIVGNRYGSVLETVPEHIAQSIPWLAGKEGHSITELEMLYAVLDKDRADGCADSAFYLRSDRLSRELYGAAPTEGETARARLEELKQRIAADEFVPSASYDTMEEFGELVMRDLLRWLDAHFPASADVGRIRRQWYDGELLRGYLPPKRMEQFLDTYLAESKKPLLFFGDGARGKTAFLTAWQPAEGRKIVVNLAADDRFSYWPSVARHLVDCMQGLEPACGCPEGMAALSDGGDFYDSDEKKERFRLAFLRWFGGLQVSQPVTVVINDLNLLEDEQGRLLSWLPAVPPRGIRLLGSTNDDEMVQNAALLGWNTKEMALFEQTAAATLVTDYLHTFGKKVTEEQLDRLLRSACAGYPGQLRFVAAFLVNFGRFNNLDELIDTVGGFREIGDMYRYAYNYLMSEYSTKERAAVRLVLALVRCATFSLNEGLCYEICRRTHDLTAIEWARCCRVFEQFEIIQGDYWNLRNEEMQKFADRLLDTAELQEAHVVLGDRFLQELRQNAADADLRQRTAYAKAALHHYRRAEAWDQLTDALSEDRVLTHLYPLDWQCVRVAWMALFLHTDRDIPTHLIDLARRYMGQGSDVGRAVALRLATLFVDLGYATGFEEMRQVVGVSAIPSALDVNLEWMLTPDFTPVYQALCRMKAEGDYRGVLENVTALQQRSTYAFNDKERCQLLFFKADAESRLHLYEAALTTVNAYYETAIRAGLSYEIVRALTMRGEVVFRLDSHADREKECLAIQERLVQMALVNGDLRSYLFARNMMGMCIAHMRGFVEASIIFDLLFEHWTKLGNLQEMGTIIINKCNAYHWNGKHAAAMDLAKGYYDTTRDVPQLQGVCTLMLSHMGRFATAMKDYAAAEEYLLEAARRAKESGHEPALLNAYGGLVEMYEESDRMMKAVEIREEQLEFFWSRGEYETLLKSLHATTDTLYHHGYTKRARLLEQAWRERFATIDGGEALFEQSRHTAAVDTVQTDDLQEQVIMAKGDGDLQKQADLLFRLAAAETTDLAAAVGHLIEAMGLYRSIGQHHRCLGCVDAALERLIHKGDLQDVALCQRLLAAAEDPSVNEIVRVWTSLAELKEQEDASVYPRVMALLEFDPVYEAMTARCVMDTASLLMYALTAEELVNLTERFTFRLRQEVCDAFDRAMFANEGRDNAQLRIDFLSPAATETLRFYEKTVVYLGYFNKMNAAAVAGNIALIFRRRKDKEKTLHYHALSAERFRRAGQQQDALIEMMNLSTAYREFGDIEGAIRLLREAVAHAASCGEKKMEALIAGNLASCLVSQNNPADREEILRCFALEENYFRETAHDRDLIISLVNQMIYLHDKTEPSAWRHKLEEATALVNKNHFDEYRSVLGKLEWFASRQGGTAAPAADGDEADFRQKAQALLDAVGGYEITAVDCTNGTYRAVCTPTEQKLPGNACLLLFHRYDTAGVVGVVSVYQPPVNLKEMDKVTAYMQWWNGMEEYVLGYDTDQQCFRADVRLVASDWDKMAARLRRFVELWEVDVVNIVSILLGIVDVDLARGAKLKAFNDDDTAN